MSITLGSNIASLRGQRQLSKTSAELGTVFQRLSSGQRINKASDDAAGLAIADSLKANSRIYNQGVRNLNDGLSLLSIADSAVENLSDIVIRIEELAAQSANGVYTNKHRKAMDDEAQALSKEFFRISKATEFNGQRLLSGEVQSVNLQAGTGANAVLSAGVGGAIGTGGFSSPSSVQMEATDTYGLTLGDLNGDGLLDMVSAGRGGGTGHVTVRLGSGSGSFGQPVSYLAEATYSHAVKLGDLNGDGILDVVTSGYSGSTAFATTRLGTGDGSFGQATSYSMGLQYPYDVALGDLNGDGYLDMLAAGYDLGPGGLAVRLGTGDGTFGAVASHGVLAAGSSTSIQLGDLNGDRILDVVIAGYNSDGWVTVKIGSGDGSFSQTTSYAMDPDGDWAASLGDLNNDGNLDIVTHGDDYTNIRLGQGNGSFGQAMSYFNGATGLTGILEDLNGDGNLDMAYSIGNGGAWLTRLGTGNGTFEAAVTLQTGGAGRLFKLAAGDLDGDGVMDIVAAHDTGLVYNFAATTKDGVAPLLPFSLRTLADARQALPVFKRKREQLAAQRGEIGAFQSRIDVARNVLEVSSENFRAAESRIRDADIAEESSRLVRLNILQQAASSVLAQANQQPALVLQLLRGG